MPRINRHGCPSRRAVSGRVPYAASSGELCRLGSRPGRRHGGRPNPSTADILNISVIGWWLNESIDLTPSPCGPHHTSASSPRVPRRNSSKVLVSSRQTTRRSRPSTFCGDTHGCTDAVGGSEKDERCRDFESSAKRSRLSHDLTGRNPANRKASLGMPDPTRWQAVRGAWNGYDAIASVQQNSWPSR